MKTRRLLVAAIAAAALPAHALDFPSKPLTLLVPFPPGGSTDMVARVLADCATPTSPERFGELMKAEVARWAPIVKVSGEDVD